MLLIGTVLVDAVTSEFRVLHVVNSNADRNRRFILERCKLEPAAHRALQQWVVFIRFFIMGTIINTSTILRVLDMGHRDTDWNRYLGLQLSQRQVVIVIIILLIIVIRHLIVNLFCAVIDTAAVLGVLHVGY